ncbi:MAG TPA: hypothetical protein VHX60_13145 [Acidobacteriaceae bacterium]|nr:hypothetical protein [Acidobacteriaceae bacterium]
MFYGAYLAFIVAAWAMDSGGYAAGFLTLEFTILASPILGGYIGGWFKPGSVGLVKPFGGNETLRFASRIADIPILGRIHSAMIDSREMRNDERDLNRRDRAHYRAYRVLALLVMLGFTLEFLNDRRFPALESVGISINASQHAVSALLQMGYNLAITLPSAILLWTEPDLMSEAETLPGATQ